MTDKQFDQLSVDFRNFTGLKLEKGNPENFDLFFKYLNSRFTMDLRDVTVIQNNGLGAMLDIMKSNN